jgi:DNA-binding transcriptional regulator LsrR (DeoR family)
MASAEELRLMTRVARMYYGEGCRQPVIANALGLSQARVSRLLKRAEHEGIVRITVSPPPGVFPNLEEELQRTYGLQFAIVVEGTSDEERLLPELGAAAAYYVETTLRPGDLVGISSWSASLLAMVDAMQPVPKLSGVRVVQILGGVGNPSARVHANRLTHRLAELVSGEVVPLPSPGLAGSPESARALREDPFVATAISMFGKLAVALVGIGALEPSRLLASSGNVLNDYELAGLRQAGAVGDIGLRFFTADGTPVASPIDERVIGIRLKQLRGVNRCVAVAGGPRKTEAIRGALRGGWVHVLITDRRTAEAILAH